MRLLLLGLGPLPFERSRKHSAPGLRTWQFCRPLLQDGHRLRLVTFGEAARGAPPAGSEGLSRVRLSAGDFLDGPRLRRVRDEFAPEAMITASSYQCTRAAASLGQDSELPLWIDLPGDLLAEAQLRAAAAGDERLVADYRSILLPALARGDRFSVVSARQRHCLVGQLGLAGRLGPATLGEELVELVPAGVEPPSEPAGRLSSLPPAGSFVVFSSGGYNTWTDVPTLFQGLAEAMRRDPTIHFVSAGGAIAGHAEQPYQQLQQLVRGSPLRRRFHLLGWLRPGQLRALYARGQLGINLDRPCYEAELGSRNRVLDWLRHGLCCLSTTCSELTSRLADEGLIVGLAPGDPAALARRLLELSAARDELPEMGRRARLVVLQRYSLGRTTQPLRRWALAPCRAGDLPLPEQLGGQDPEALAAELQRLDERLRVMHRSLTYRTMRRGERLAGRLKRSIFPKKLV